jgi:hypothetical protein
MASVYFFCLSLQTKQLIQSDPAFFLAFAGSSFGEGRKPLIFTIEHVLRTEGHTFSTEFAGRSCIIRVIGIGTVYCTAVSAIFMVLEPWVLGYP